MKNVGGDTVSIWMADQPPVELAGLNQDTQTDVCVIGAGIAGITTAYLLCKEGKRVVVLDDGPAGGGETGRTTAHLTNVMDDRFYVLERSHGPEGARIAAESHGAAIERIEAIIREEGIACDLERLSGYLFLGEHDAQDVLDRELAAAHRAGLTGVELLPRVPFASFDGGPCLRFPRQGQFHVLRYLNGLVRAIQKSDGQILQAHVEKVEPGPPAQVHTSAGQTVKADFVVCATNTPIVDWIAIHTKQAAYRTFAIAARVAKDAVPAGLYWDTGSPYHYIRLQNDLLIVGGEDHKTGQADDSDSRFMRLEEWTRARFPIGEVEFRWSGQVMEPVDGMAYIGRNPGNEDNIFIATGDSGQGMTHGTIAGILITDLITGRENPWEKLYDPSRKPLRALAEYASENVNAVKQFVDYLTPGEVDSAEDLPYGSGAIVRDGLNKSAIHRDNVGKLHRLSAVCPHLGCIVHWNSLEKSWDCPCHGSRFTPGGEVMNGPALTGLTRQGSRKAA